jgi:hypothetical protein
MLQAHVHCTTNTIYGDDVIQCPLCFLYTVYRSAEVREYKRVHKLVNREDETMSHIVLNDDNKE